MKFCQQERHTLPSELTRVTDECIDIQESNGLSISKMVRSTTETRVCDEPAFMGTIVNESPIEFAHRSRPDWLLVRLALDNNATAIGGGNADIYASISSASRHLNDIATALEIAGNLSLKARRLQGAPPSSVASEAKLHGLPHSRESPDDSLAMPQCLAGRHTNAPDSP